MSGCKICGDCCREVAFPVNPRSADWAQLHGMRLSIEQDVLMVRLPIPCLKLNAKTGRCRIYAHRPETCKLYLCDKAQA